MVHSSPIIPITDVDNSTRLESSWWPSVENQLGLDPEEQFWDDKEVALDSDEGETKIMNKLRNTEIFLLR